MRITKKQWENIGKQAGWIKKQASFIPIPSAKVQILDLTGAREVNVSTPVSIVIEVGGQEFESQSIPITQLFSKEEAEYILTALTKAGVGNFGQYNVPEQW